MSAQPGLAPSVLRSALYMPSSNERALEKAKTIAADAIIFDLEDAVAPDAKEAARANAVAAVQGNEYGHKTLTIRCNGLDTPWGAEDLAAAAAVHPNAIVIPKVSGPDHLTQITAITGATPLWAMIETPAALFAIREICLYPQVHALVMGTNDLVKELRAAMVPGRAPLLPHLALALAGARLAGKTILDGVWNDVKDLEGFRAECVQGFEMGFDGKTLIHPAQVE
ncbi:MAG: CoA ester lyase, partial [Mycobacteriales bacterium]